MKLYLDTSTNICILKLNNHKYECDLGRNMTDEILTFIYDKLRENGCDWKDISEITYFSGPGSFTGLRIGAAIVNTIADQLGIPLFDHHGIKHQIILPDYGKEANITKPSK